MIARFISLHLQSALGVVDRSAMPKIPMGAANNAYFYISWALVPLVWWRGSFWTALGHVIAMHLVLVGTIHYASAASICFIANALWYLYAQPDHYVSTYLVVAYLVYLARATWENRKP